MKTESKREYADYEINDRDITIFYYEGDMDATKELILSEYIPSDYNINIVNGNEVKVLQDYTPQDYFWDCIGVSELEKILERWA